MEGRAFDMRGEDLRWPGALEGHHQACWGVGALLGLDQEASSQVPRPLGTLRAQMTGDAFSLRPQHDQTCPFAEDAIIIFFSVVKYLP